MKRIQSFEDLRRRRSIALRTLKYIAILFIAYESFSAFALKSLGIASSSMAPTLLPKERIIVASSAYGIFNPFTGGRAVLKTPARGDIVLVRLPSSLERPWYGRLADAVLRFLTVQRIGLPNSRAAYSAPVIKRVVAAPGDSVMMDGFIVHVRVKGASHFLTEYEVSGGAYDIGGPATPSGWGKEMPLSGTYGAVELGADEFFLVGDNRSASSDSRFFGPVSSKDILGKVVLRYWPLDRASSL